MRPALLNLPFASLTTLPGVGPKLGEAYRASAGPR